MKYAVVENGVVINVILLDDPTNYVTENLLILSDIANTGDAWDGENFIPSQLEFVLLPNWSAFNNGLLINSAYNRMAELSTNQRAVSRLEGIAIPLGIQGNDNGAMYQTIALLWNLMIDGVSEGLPTQEEVEEWQAIATAASMPFSFNTDGKMIIADHLNPA